MKKIIFIMINLILLFNYSNIYAAVALSPWQLKSYYLSVMDELKCFINNVNISIIIIFFVLLISFWIKSNNSKTEKMKNFFKWFYITFGIIDFNLIVFKILVTASMHSGYLLDMINIFLDEMDVIVFGGKIFIACLLIYFLFSKFKNKKSPKVTKIIIFFITLWLILIMKLLVYSFLV